MVFVPSFHPRGGVFCCSWRDGAFFFFSEAGRGGFFFPRRAGAIFFFSEAGRGGFFFFFDGAVFFFSRGPGRDGCFWRWQFFWRDGAKSLHRPASRPCKALKFSLCQHNLRTKIRAQAHNTRKNKNGMSQEIFLHHFVKNDQKRGYLYTLNDKKRYYPANHFIIVARVV